jgi:hypothetical protein
VQVKACGIVPNLGNVLTYWQTWFIGSNWFSPGDGQALADMARAGTLPISVFEHQVHKLADINTVLAGLPKRNGGFTNFVVGAVTACPGCGAARRAHGLRNRSTRRGAVHR